MNKTTHLSNSLFVLFRTLALLIAAFALIGSPVSAQEIEKQQESESSGSAHASGESDGHDHASDHQGEASGSQDENDDSPLIDPDSGLYKAVKYVGKYHIMVLHMPIAFLFGAMVVQWYVVVKRKGEAVVATMIWFGTLGALGAAALGWMYAYDSVYFGESENILFWHRWLGTGTAALALIVLVIYRKLGSKSLAIALTLCAGLVAAAGHFGASLVYGPDFLLKF